MAGGVDLKKCQQLLHVDYTLAYSEDTFSPDIQDMDVGGILDPLRVQIQHVSFTLCFNYLFRHDNERTYFEVEVSNLETTLDHVVVQGTIFDNRNWNHNRAKTGSVMKNGRLLRVQYEPVMTVNLVVKVFSSSPLPAAWSLGKQLDSLRASRAMCDVVLVADGVEHAAHRVVLAARSPVLRAMLESDQFKEGREGRVELTDVPRELLAKFLEFLYTESVADWLAASSAGPSEGLPEGHPEGHPSKLPAGPRVDCVVGLLEMANRYLVTDLAAECERRLLLHLGPKNAVAMLTMSLEKESLHVVPSSVRRAAAQVVMDCWDKVSATEEWQSFKTKFPIHADLVSAAPLAASAASEYTQKHGSTYS